MNLFLFTHILRIHKCANNILADLFNAPNYNYDLTLSVDALSGENNLDLEKNNCLYITYDNTSFVYTPPTHTINSITFNDMELSSIKFCVYKKSRIGYKTFIMTGTLDLSRIDKNLPESKVTVSLYKSATLGECINLHDVKADGLLTLTVRLEANEVTPAHSSIEKGMKEQQAEFMPNAPGKREILNNVYKHFMNVFTKNISLKSMFNYSAAVKRMFKYGKEKNEEIKSTYTPITDEIKKDGYFAAVSAMAYQAQDEYVKEKNQNSKVKKISEEAKYRLETLGSFITKGEFKILDYYPQKVYRPGFLAVEKDKETVVIGFKGTSTFDELFACILYNYEYSEGHLLHEGVRKIMYTFIKKYWKIYLDIIKGYKKVYITGHSLGGSLATMLHYASYKSGLLTADKTITAVTFSPLPGIQLPKEQEIPNIRNYVYGDDATSFLSGGTIKNIKLLLKSLINNYYAHGSIIHGNPHNFKDVLESTISCILKKYNHSCITPLGKTIHIKNFDSSSENQSNTSGVLCKELTKEDLAFPNFSNFMVQDHDITKILGTMYDAPLPDEVFIHKNRYSIFLEQ